MKRALLFLTAGVLSLLLFGSLAGCGDTDLAPKSQSDQNISEMKSEVKTEVKAATGAIQAAAPAQPAPVSVPAAEEEEEDQFGC